MTDTSKMPQHAITAPLNPAVAVPFSPNSHTAAPQTSMPTKIPTNPRILSNFKAKKHSGTNIIKLLIRCDALTWKKIGK